MAYKGKRYAKKINIKNSVDGKVKLVIKNNFRWFIIIAIIVISVTVIPTLAYLVANVELDLSLNGGNELKIQNGYTDLSLDNEAGTGWTNITPNIPVISGSKITDPLSFQEISYGPVYIMTPQNSLSSNLDIQTEYILKKIGGTLEKLDASSENILAEPFEVIVGDIDNFNFGIGSYDFYSGVVTSKHGMDFYPSGYDAQGTDRRMTPSGFYRAGTQLFSKVDTGNPGNGLRLGTINGASTIDVDNKAYYRVIVNNSVVVDGVTLPSGLMINYDGYVDRAIVGQAGKIVDGVDWGYLQMVKPITFKYNDIKEYEGISSVNFQIFTDDLQSGEATKEANPADPSKFKANCSSYFSVYLSERNGINKINVTEFAEVINKYAQSGPIGTLINLNLPSEYFSIIKKASGLGKGLELLIDDNRLGTSGDSFAIDFAKMTVNHEAAKGANNAISKITGKVVDINSAPISGVQVATGDGKNTITAADGTYKISGSAPGLLSLTFSHYKYKTDTLMYGNATNGSTIDAGTKILYKGRKAEIPGKEKLQVEFTVQKCDLSGAGIGDPIILKSTNLNSNGDYKLINTSGTGTKVLHSQQLKDVEPGTRYKLTYKLILKSHEDIGDITGFNLLFSSRIRAKLTQENNPLWSEDGTESGYATKVNEPHGEGLISSETGGEGTLYSEIYFERPTTSNYWSEFSSGALPLFYLNSTTALSSANISKVTDGSDWYKYTFPNKTSITENSYIKIVDGANSSNTSGKLNYFSTQKVFICTN